MRRWARTAGDVAIIALLALAVAFVPGGGNAATAASTALVIAFLVALGFAARQLYAQNRFTIDTLSDRDRGILYAGAGLIVLMIAGADSLLDTPGGTLLWVGLLALGVVIIARVWMEASRY
jgi:Kef-type K+ transport system membrane component KefB